MRPKIMEPYEDNVFGIDYFYRGVSIDQKFSFGDLGEEIIKIRTRERRLLNESDWTMAINREGIVELFETKKMDAFVRKNWDLVQKKTLDKGIAYNTHAVSLKDFYRIEGIVPVVFPLIEENLFVALEEMVMHEIDYENKVCMLKIQI